jgi:hypothetical protein
MVSTAKGIAQTPRMFDVYLGRGDVRNNPKKCPGQT